MSNVIWVNDADNVLGEVERNKAHIEGLPHRISVVYLTNEKGEILVQERAKDGHLDHSSAGHVDPGESYLEAAGRELKEELGVQTTLTKIGHSHAIDQRAELNGLPYNSHHVFDVFVAKAAPVRIDPEEVKSVYWAKAEDVLEDMAVHPERYTNGFKESIKVFIGARA